MFLAIIRAVKSSKPEKVIIPLKTPTPDNIFFQKGTFHEKGIPLWHCIPFGLYRTLQTVRSFLLFPLIAKDRIWRADLAGLDCVYLNLRFSGLRFYIRFPIFKNPFSIFQIQVEAC